MFVATSANGWTGYSRYTFNDAFTCPTFDELMGLLLELYRDGLDEYGEKDIEAVFNDWDIVVYETKPEPLRINIIPRVEAKAVILPT